MNKSIILLTLSLLFSFITVCGAGYVLLARGEKNAGYAVIPMVVSILYTNTSPKKWKLVRPKYAGEASSGGYYFRANQTTTNKSDLNEFRVTVNSIASKESELKTLVGLASFLGGFATGFAIGSGGTGFGVAVAAYLAAAGFGVAAQQKANEIGELQDTAYSRYYDVFHNSVVYY